MATEKELMDQTWGDEEKDEKSPERPKDNPEDPAEVTEGYVQELATQTESKIETDSAKVASESATLQAEVTEKVGDLLPDEEADFAALDQTAIEARDLAINAVEEAGKAEAVAEKKEVVESAVEKEKRFEALRKEVQAFVRGLLSRVYTKENPNYKEYFAGPENEYSRLVDELDQIQRSQASPISEKLTRLIEDGDRILMNKIYVSPEDLKKLEADYKVDRHPDPRDQYRDKQQLYAELGNYWLHDEHARQIQESGGIDNFNATDFGKDTRVFREAVTNAKNSEAYKQDLALLQELKNSELIKNYMSVEQSIGKNRDGSLSVSPEFKNRAREELTQREREEWRKKEERDRKKREEGDRHQSG